MQRISIVVALEVADDDYEEYYRSDVENGRNDVFLALLVDLINEGAAEDDLTCTGVTAVKI